MKKHFLVISLLILCSNVVYPAVKDAPFLQEDVTRYSWQDFNGEAITDMVFDNQNNLWLLSDQSLFLYDKKNLRAVHERLNINLRSGMKIAYSPEIHAMIIAGTDGIYRYPLGGKAQWLDANLGEVNDLIITTRGDAWIGTDQGLYRLNRTENNFHKIEQIDTPVRALAFSQEGIIAVGTDQALFRFDGKNWRHEWIPGLIDNAITALIFDDEGTLWIGNRDSISLQKKDLTFQRISGLDGLPYNHITTFSLGNDGSIWIGTEKGAIRYQNGQWHYYYGPRWIMGEHVQAIASDKAGITWISTQEGASRIEFARWNLARKANHYQRMVRPRHDRYGLVAECGLQNFGDLDSYYLRDSDNDGLWTSIYLASLCFQYAVTQDPEAKKLAWYHFAAMEKLEAITGVDGFFARTYVKKGEPHASGGEWHDSADGEWVWKGDTSSDELVGHMFVYPIMYDLVAETPEEKERVRTLVAKIMEYVVDNGFYLLDIDGQPTTWGVWAPEKLNDDPEWAMERGLNSLQILAFLAAAHYMTNEQKFLDAFHTLIEEHDYHINAINQKIQLPSDNNHSDDELAFLPYYTLFHYYKGEPYKDIFQRSLDRAWEIERPEKSSLWNIIYGSTGAESFDLEEALWTLQEWPRELIDWPCRNSHRLDIRIHPDKDRFGNVQSVEVLPPSERPLRRWNGNPYRLDGGGGHHEDDPGAWLLPYWMARYYEFISG